MSLPRDRRLASGARIREVQRRGRRAGGPMGRLCALRRGDARPAALACVATKALGGAVARNRGRRRAKACFAALGRRLAPGWDLVFRAEPAVLRASFSELSAAIEDLCEQAGVLREPDDAGQRADSAER